MADAKKRPRCGPVKRAVMEELRTWSIVAVVLLVMWGLQWLG